MSTDPRMSTHPGYPKAHMACIYLRHPVHGTKVATMQLEADADIKNGWSQYDPTPMNIPTEGLTKNPPVVYNETIPAAPAKKVK